MHRLRIHLALTSFWLISIPFFHAQETAAQWEVLDISQKLKKPVESPFDIVYGAVFKHENGIKINIPGFYNGENEWILRFSHAEKGNWTYQTYSSIAKLSGKTGTVTITTNQKPDRHGGIVLSQTNQQAFFYEDGSPYFLLAFELDWLYALDYYNSTDIPKTKSIINAIKENGLNQVVMNVFAYDVVWEKDKNLKSEHEYGSPKDIFPFAGTNENPDHSTLNPDFFKHLDRVIAYLHDQEIVSHLMIYVWNKKVNWPEANSEADNRYFDYVVKRYQAFPNIIWDISKEALGYGHDDINYISERITRLQKNDSYQRLLTVHDYGYCAKYPEKVDFISIQSWTTSLYQRMRDIRNQFKNKPIFNIEHGGYEESPYVVFTGDYTNAEVCLRRNYECIFAGTYSTYYWQATSWNVVIHDPFNHNPKPRFDYYQHLTKFFKKYDFTQFKPQGGLSTSGFCLENGKGTYLYFIPKESYAIHTTFPEPTSGKVKTKWFNTYTGEFSEVKEMNVVKWQEYRSPWKNTDAILIIE